jgi:peptide/nickel transport system substrate-binding protein
MKHLLNPTRFTLAIAAGFMAWSASTVPAQAQAPKPGGTLVMAFPQTPRHLNSAVQSGVATAVPAAQLFASPLRFDDKWQPQPYLAESWQLAEDGKSLTLNLRKDAVFHDGKPITSADVAFSLMAIKKNHPFDSMLAPLDKVETPDAHTAVLRMSRPHPAIILAMSPALAPILPKHVYDDGKDLKNHPRNSKDVVGSGPFRLVAFEPGRRVLLEKFDKYFLKGKPYLDKLVIDVTPDTTSTMVGLERGSVQMLPFFSNTTDLQRLRANKQIAVTDKGYEGVGAMNWLAFNLKDKALSDVRVRKAISYTVDMNFINKALNGGASKSADGPIVPSSPYATKDLVTYPVDLKKAAALLDEAGFKVGPDKTRMKLVLDYVPGGGGAKALAEYVRAQLKKVDVAVDVRTSADFPSWAKRMADHEFQMSIDTVFNWGDPVIGVHRTYLTSNIKNQVWTNTQSYSNKKVDELLEQAGQEMDMAKRKALYAQFQKIVTDEAPIRFLNLVPYHTLTRANVGNVPTTIWGPVSPLDEVFLK